MEKGKEKSSIFQILLAIAINRENSRCEHQKQAQGAVSSAALADDLDAQDIISLNLERAVRLCVDAGSHLLLDFEIPSPDSMAGVFLAMGKLELLSEPIAERMAKAAGFRNIAVHEYRSVDWNIVYAIVTTRLGDFRDFASAVQAKLEGKPSDRGSTGFPSSSS